jgi:hypothetical protein
MFGDTITVGALSFNKIAQNGSTSVYRNAFTGGETTMTMRQSTRTDASRGNKKVVRANIEMLVRTFAVAPALFDKLSKFYFVLEFDGDSIAADIVTNGAVLPTYLLASSNAALTKLVNREY